MHIVFLVFILTPDSSGTFFYRERSGVAFDPESDPEGETLVGLLILEWTPDFRPVHFCIEAGTKTKRCGNANTRENFGSTFVLDALR